eukprot:6042517-Pleurochrysis_carterae.AAC.2
MRLWAFASTDLPLPFSRSSSVGKSYSRETTCPVFGAISIYVTERAVSSGSERCEKDFRPALLDLFARDAVAAALEKKAVDVDPLGGRADRLVLEKREAEA